LLRRRLSVASCRFRRALMDAPKAFETAIIKKICWRILSKLEVMRTRTARASILDPARRHLPPVAFVTE
jgi:hypothetical protein